MAAPWPAVCVCVCARVCVCVVCVWVCVVKFHVNGLSNPLHGEMLATCSEGLVSGIGSRVE